MSALKETVGDTAVVEGTVAPGFDGVAQAFIRNFREHGEVGASVCVSVGG